MSKIAFGVTPIAAEPGASPAPPFEVNICSRTTILSRACSISKAPHFRRGLTIGILGALLIHVAGATEAARLANGLGGWARDTRSNIHQYFERLYEVEMVNAPPPPPPPPEEKTEPEAPKPLPASKAPREQEPAPAPAQAGKILTQEPDPDAPVDLTGQGFVTGNAETYAGGVTASNGTSAPYTTERDSGRCPRRHGNEARSRRAVSSSAFARGVAERRTRMGLPLAARGERGPDRFSAGVDDGDGACRWDGAGRAHRQRSRPRIRPDGAAVCVSAALRSRARSRGEARAEHVASRRDLPALKGHARRAFV